MRHLKQKKKGQDLFNEARLLLYKIIIFTYFIMTEEYKKNNVNKLLNTFDQPLKKETEFSIICQTCGYISYYESDSHALTHMTLIIPYLYLGSRINAHSLHELQFFEIKTIINVAQEISKICANEFKYIKYNWLDYFNYNILLDIDDIVDQIHNEISNKNTVLIHCAMGISRSATVVIGYLMKYKKMKYEEAYEHVKSLRKCINPNIGFVNQLIKYGQKL